MPEVLILPGTARRRKLLERLIFSDLVFPMCWEDPEVDARALCVEPTDVAITITSAGCNVLHLLLQGPRKVVSVDCNPAPNALLELKLAAIAELDWNTFSDIFSGAAPWRVRTVYGRLRPRLSQLASAFWDRRLNLVERNVYRGGRMGMFFSLVRGWLRARGVTAGVLSEFFSLATLEEQQEFYARRLAPRLWSRWSSRLSGFAPLLYLSGVHPNQLVRLREDTRVCVHARRSIEHALTELPVRSNYFWQMAMLGRFVREAPAYLTEANFPVLRQRLGRIQVVYGWLDEYLSRIDSHSVQIVNLRDALDWTTRSDRQRLWDQLARVCSAGARVVLRSAASRVSLGDAGSAQFRANEELSTALTFADRSATHGCVLALQRAPVAAVED